MKILKINFENLYLVQKINDVKISYNFKDDIIKELLVRKKKDLVDNVEGYNFY